MAGAFSRETLYCDYVRGNGSKKLRMRVVRCGSRYLVVTYPGGRELDVQGAVSHALGTAIACANTYHERLLGDGWRLPPAAPAKQTAQHRRMQALFADSAEPGWAW